MERRGSGLKKILKEYESENSPQFYSDQQYFIVTLINKNYANKKTTQKTTQKTGELILTLIAQNSMITRNEISKQLGDITPSGVKYNLKKLKDKGIIKRVGADKGGCWEIVDILQENKE